MSAAGRSLKPLNRHVKIAVIQPPAWVAADSDKNLVTCGLDLFEQAAGGKPDVVCLPEYFNCADRLKAGYYGTCADGAQDLLSHFSDRAKALGCYVLLPLVIDAGGRRFNRAHLIGRDGRIIGYFDKIHITETERVEMGIEAGSLWPVFDLDFGRVGIMICYDGCFPESSRILALAGAKIIFWPSMQRLYTRDELELQMRSHAYFNFATIVRSSYGGALSGEPESQRMVGLSGVCGNDGKLLATLDTCSGWTAATVDLRRELRGQRTFGGQVGSLREMRFEDRRTDVYTILSESRQAVIKTDNCGSKVCG